MHRKVTSGDLLPALRELILAEKPTLPAEKIIDGLRREKLGPWLYYRLNGILPSDTETELKNEFLHNSQRALKQEFAIAEIRKILAGAQLPFLLLKGSALSSRIYPSPALRYMCDIDIFVPENDSKKAFRILKEANWEPVLDYNSDNHLPTLKKYDTFLEVHFDLPGVKRGYTGDFARRISDGTGEINMSDEWHFALLFCHAARHNWDNWVRFMSDAALLAKSETFDFIKASQELSAMGYRNPEKFFRAFNEFFPRYTAGKPDCSGMREIFEDLFDNWRNFIHFRHEITAQRQTSRTGWIKKRLLGLRFSVIRFKYNIPRNRWDKILVFWVKDLFKKIAVFSRMKQNSSNPELLKYLDTAKRAEELLGAEEIDHR